MAQTTYIKILTDVEDLDAAIGDLETQGYEILQVIKLTEKYSGSGSVYDISLLVKE